MLRHLLPAEDRFFPMLSEQVDLVAAVSQALVDLLNNYGELGTRATAIYQLQDKGRSLRRIIINSLDTSFITPIDREDIHALTAAIDKILVNIVAGVRRMQLFKLQAPVPEMTGLAELLLAASGELKAAISLLGAVSNGGSGAEIRTRLINLSRLENDGDVLHHTVLVKLFRDEKDPFKVIKIKEVSGFLEEALDHFQRASHVMESILVKNT